MIVNQSTFNINFQIEVVLEKQSSNGKWSFFLKKDFAAICSMIGMKNVPWTVVVDSFPPEKLICPFQPVSKYY